MADSEWESIRKKTGNRIRYGIGIGIPALFIAGFLFYNNRDLFYSSVQSEHPVRQTDSAFVGSLQDSIADDSVQKKYIDVDVSDSSVKKADSVVVRIAPEIKEVAKSKAVDKSSDTKPEVINVVVSEAIQGSILELFSISCRTADLNGPILTLSVELKSGQRVIDKQIFIMRDELKVLIQNVVRSKEINALNKEQLKTEIIQSVNKYIGKEVFNNLKFTEFKVEKVIKK